MKKILICIAKIILVIIVLFTRVSSLMFQFLDQNRYDTSFKALIIMFLQYMLI